jgi:hypothetical protein
MPFLAQLIASRDEPEAGLALCGFADLGLGDRVEPVLEALVRAAGGRFSGGQ